MVTYNVMNIIGFAKIVGRLKRLKRSGWVRNKVSDPESVAEHSFRLAILAMVLAPKIGVDQLKVVKMALIHDIGEAEIGDIVTKRGSRVLQNLKNKKIAERNALKRILSLVDKDEYIKLFDEFEENKTKEAQFIKQLDKLEMGIQASEYEDQQNLDLQEFFEDTRTVVVDEYLRKILEELERLRKGGTK